MNEFQKKGLISADALKCITAHRSETPDPLAFLLSIFRHPHMIVVKLEGDEVNPETKYFMLCVLAGSTPDLSISEECSEVLQTYFFDCGQQYCTKVLFSSPYNIKAQATRIQMGT